MGTLKFAPLQSYADSSFWSELGERKLDHFRLSEEPVDIQGRPPALTLFGGLAASRSLAI